MSKALTRETTWRERSASFSTHGSRRGVSLLDWHEGREEYMSPEQERNALVARVKQLQALFTEGRLSVDERARLGQEQLALQTRINEIRPKLRGKFPGVDKFILDVVRERLTKLEFKSIYEEAIRRWNKSQAENDQDSSRG